MQPTPVLPREEYIEQAYFFGACRQRLEDGWPTQQTLEHLTNELLSTTRLPLAVQFLVDEVKHAGQIGGAMRIGVPYDLSWGAWQDPTHVRAFNERSWLYYTDWHWYLGWAEARFDMKEMGMKLSPVGEALRQRGVPGDEIFRTPRAVDEMQVVLVKRSLNDAERQQALAYIAGRREN